MQGHPQIRTTQGYRSWLHCQTFCGPSPFAALCLFSFKSQTKETNKEIQFKQGPCLMFLFCYTRVSLGQKICLDFHSSNWSQPCGTAQKYMDGGAATASCLSRCGGDRELGWKGTDLEREKESESERASEPQRNRTETLRHTHTQKHK